VDWATLGTALTRLHLGWALLGWALTSLLIVGLALRWQIFLRQQRITLPFITVLSLTWAGQFFNSVLPGSTGGDVVKIYQLCRFVPDRKAAAAATVFLDRLTALVALVVLAGIAMIIDPVPLHVLSMQSLSTRMLSWLFISLAMLALATGLLFRAIRSTLWGGRLVRTLAAAKDNLSLNQRLLAAVLLAFAIHLTNFLIAYLFARALGISITYLQILIIVPVVLFFVMLPITINGHGLRELLLIGYFSQMGFTLTGHPETGVREIAIAFSLLLVANDLLWSIPGGIWYMLRFKPAERRLTTSPESGRNTF
jgi:glycosyltransferase 2 family protein